MAFWRDLVREGSPGVPTTDAFRMPDPGPSAEQTILARERLAVVQAAVNRLSHRQRACFLLRFIEAMTLEEIAQAMKLKVATVKVHLARGVRAVQRDLAKWESSCENI